MDPINFLKAITTAIENRGKALEAEAEKLAEEGAALEAKVKKSVGAEFTNLVAEIKKLAGEL